MEQAPGRPPGEADVQALQDAGPEGLRILPRQPLQELVVLSQRGRPAPLPRSVALRGHSLEMPAHVCPVTAHNLLLCRKGIHRQLNDTCKQMLGASITGHSYGETLS